MNTINTYNSKMIRLIIFAFITSTAIFSSQELSATHIVGGDLTYTCMSSGEFQFQLNFRRDCFFGSPEADFDDPAVLGIFDINGNLLTSLGDNGQIVMEFTGRTPVESMANEFCTVEDATVCVEETTYTGTMMLPQIDGGYIIAYQRCCHNQTLLNIVDPLETGSTYFVTIDDFAYNECNSSPTFNGWVDIYACQDQPLVFDHSAVDADSDSLVYRLCTPTTGATIDLPKPQPPFMPESTIFPFWPEVVWNSSYSTTNMFGTGVPLTIDSATGEIYAEPGTLGQFLIGICVEEYRDGQLIGTVLREFEVNVRACGEMGILDFDFLYTDCENLDVAFNNLSDGFSTFAWDITAADGGQIASSNTTDISVTFPSPGTYNVNLTGTNDSGCDLTIDRDIEIDFSGVDPTFAVTIKECNDDNTVDIQLTNTTLDAFETIQWEVLIDGLQVNVTNDDIVEIADVTFTDIVVSLTGTTDEVCVSTETVSTTLSNLLPDASFDVSLVECQGDIITVDFSDTSMFESVNPNSWDWTITTELGVDTYAGAMISADITDGSILELLVGYPNGCSGFVRDTINLQGDLLPVLSFDYEVMDCEDDGGQPINVAPVSTGETEFTIVTYAWTYVVNGETVTSSDSNIVIDINQGEMGDLTLTVTYDNGCSITNTELIDPTDFITIVSIDATPLDCTLENGVFDVILSPTYAGVLNSPVSFNWTYLIDGQVSNSTEENVTFSIMNDQSVDVTLAVTFDNGCTGIVTQTLNANDIIPAVDIVVTESMCNDDGTVTATIGYIVGGNVVVNAQNWTINNTVSSEETITVTVAQDAEIEVDVVIFLDNGCDLEVTQILTTDDILGPSPLIDVIVNDCTDSDNVSITLVNITPTSTLTSPASLVWNYSIDGVPGSAVSDQVDLTVPASAIIDVLLTINYDNSCARSSQFNNLDIGVPFVIFTGEPILSCSGNIVALVANPNSDWTYEWEPIDGLMFDSESDFSNPTIEAAEQITYTVTVTNEICSVVDSVTVMTMDDQVLTVAGDTDVCGDTFTLSIQDPIMNVDYEWSSDINFSAIIFTGTEFVGSLDGEQSATLYVRIKDDNPQCLVGTQSVTVTNQSVNLEVVDPFRLCTQDTVEYFIINNNTNDILTIQWADDPHIIDVVDNSRPVIVGGDIPESFSLDFIATNQFGCQESGVLNVLVEEQPFLNFEYIVEECGELTVCFTPSGNANNLYIYDFGDPGNPGNEAIGTDLCYTFSDFGTYTVNLTGVGSVCSGQPYSESITLIDEDINIDLTANGVSAMDSVTICGDELLTLMVTNDIDDEFISWCSDSGDTLAVGNTLILESAGGNLWTVSSTTITVETMDIVAKVAINTSCTSAETLGLGVYDFGPDTDIDAFDFTYLGFNCDTNLACFQANSDAANTIVWTIVGNGISMTASGDAFQCFDLTGAPEGVYSVTVSAIDAPCLIEPFTQDIEISTMGSVGVVGAIDDFVNYCIGDEVTLIGTTNIEGGVISWCDADNVELTQGDTFTFTPTGPTTIIVKLDGDNSCVDTTIVSVIPFDFGPGTEIEQLDFGFSQDDCSSTEICFNANTDAGGALIWAFSGMGIIDTIFTDQNPCYDFAAGGTGTYSVTLSAPDAPCDVNSLTQTITVGGDMDIGILGVDDGVLNYCEGDMVTAVATTSVDNPQISWCVDGVVVETGDTYTFLGSDIEELTVKLGAGTDCGDTLLVAVEAYDFGPGTENDSLFYTVDQPDCESLEVCFTPNTTADGNLVWVITGEGIAQVIADEGEEFCFIFPTSGTYNVQLSAPDAPCEVVPYSQTIEVYDMQASVTIDNGDAVAFCEEGMLSLSAMANIGNENIKWCDAEGNEVGQGATLDIMFTEPTFYVAKAGTIASCSSTDTVMVNGFDIADAMINAPDIGCEGDQVIATIEGLEPGDYSYNWAPSDCINGDVTGVSAEIIGQGLKDINVEVTDNISGCSAILMHTITFSEFGPVNLEVIENDTIFLGQEVTINVINGDDNWTYEWSTGETGVGVTSITLEPTDTDIYTVMITDENGCVTSLEMLVVVLQPNCDETDIYLPNAFTPNGDDTNDIFIPRSNFIEEVEFFVYNRWGEEIFFTTNMNEGWDGTFKGESLAPDVFAYCLKVTCPNDEEFVKSGNVSLLR